MLYLESQPYLTLPTLLGILIGTFAWRSRSREQYKWTRLGLGYVHSTGYYASVGLIWTWTGLGIRRGPHGEEERSNHSRHGWREHSSGLETPLAVLPASCSDLWWLLLSSSRQSRPDPGQCLHVAADTWPTCLLVVFGNRGRVISTSGDAVGRTGPLYLAPAWSLVSVRVQSISDHSC